MIRLGYRNLVTNPEIKAWVEEHLGPMFHMVRQDRIVDEERWVHFWKIWNVELDDQAYNGRSRIYLAAGRNTLETWKIALKGGLFPFSDWFDCEAKHSSGLAGNAVAEKALQRENLRHMKLREKSDAFLQQYCTYGTAVLRHGFEDEEEVQRRYERAPVGAPVDEDDEIIRVEKVVDEDEDALAFRTQQGTEVRLVEGPVKIKYGPTCRVVDLFHFFVWPVTCESVQEAILAFEDITTSSEDIERIAEQWMDPKHEEFGHIYEEIDELIETDGGRQPTDVTRTDIERHVREGLQDYVDPNRIGADLEEGFFNVTEAYWRGEIPGATDPDTGKEYGRIDWMVCLVNDKYAIRIHPNPRYRKRRPWHVARLIRVVNEFYGRGLVEPFASVQYMLNDMANLTLDNVVSALNPIVLINDDLVSNFDSLELAPNAKWFVDPEGVRFVTPPNVASIGQATMNMLLGFVQDYGRANFATQGVPAPPGRGRSQNTSSGMSMLLQSGSQGFQAALTDLEDQLMVPILESNYELQEQFMSDKMVIVEGGADGAPLIERAIGFEDVVGQYLFTWKGAQGVRERTTLVQGLQGLVQMLAQIRMIDPDAQKAFRIKWGPLAKRFLTDGYGLSWADEVIETPEDAKSMDPTLELDMLALHRMVEVQPGDDDAEHLMVQQPALQEDRFANDLIAVQLLQAHIDAHLKAAAEKQQQAQQAQMMQMMQAAQQGTGGGAPSGMASPPAPGGGGQPPNALQQAASSLSAQGQVNRGLAGGGQ